MLRSLTFAALLLFAGVAPAKNLYVNNSGTPACSDATTYAANDAANPWCTIERAAWGNASAASKNGAQAAAAGDVVLVTAGTYTPTSANAACGGSVRFNVALNPENSGTSGNLITFRGVGTVNITLASGYAGPTIGADSRNYIVWDNVRIDDSTALGVSCADTGPAVLHDCTGCKIINSTIKGQNTGVTDTPWSDNYNGIRLEATTGAVVSGNTIYNFCCANVRQNATGVMTYDTANAVIEHNYIYDVGTGIFIKGDHAADGWPQENNIIRFNWITGPYTAGVYTISAAGTDIYQNIIVLSYSSGGAIYGWWHNFNDVNNIDFVNNTVVATVTYSGNMGWAPTAGTVGTGFRIYNNIFSGAFGEVANLGGAAVGGTASEHNVYYNYTVFGSVSGAQISLATWKATHSQDTVSPAAITTNPDFASTTYPGGYKLNVGSPALTQGVDILDLDGDSSTSDTIPAGAYISGSEVIGPTGGSLLPGPTNIRFRPRASLWYWFAVGRLH